MRRIVFIAAVLAAAGAHAQTIYKCRDAAGGLVYQNAPCTGSQTTAAVKQYQIAPSASAAATQPSRPAPIVATQPQQTAYVSRYAAERPTARSEQRAECESAKAYRESVLAQVGLARNFDLLRQLDQKVYDACKGL